MSSFYATTTRKDATVSTSNYFAEIGCIRSLERDAGKASDVTRRPDGLVVPFLIKPLLRLVDCSEQVFEAGGFFHRPQTRKGIAQPGEVVIREQTDRNDAIFRQIRIPNLDQTNVGAASAGRQAGIFWPSRPGTTGEAFRLGFGCDFLRRVWLAASRYVGPLCRAF